MEVHHHAHTSRKKWTHYFWEFLMLFLAVFCGFMAENLREHKVEHIRAKEFSKSLVKDLENDTIAINTQKKTAQTFIAISDSLLRLSNTKLDGPNAVAFSFYTRFMYWTAPLNWNRATFEQIKNSGSLRYFRNQQLLEKLMKYDALINDVEGEFVNHQTRGNMLLNLINKVMDPGDHHEISKYFIWSIDSISLHPKDYQSSINTQSLENRREEIREMLNMIVVQQRNLRFGLDRLNRAQALATELAKEFREEYHIK